MVSARMYNLGFMDKLARTLFLVFKVLNCSQFNTGLHRVRSLQYMVWFYIVFGSYNAFGLQLFNNSHS